MLSREYRAPERRARGTDGRPPRVRLEPRRARLRRTGHATRTPHIAIRAARRTGGSGVAVTDWTTSAAMTPCKLAYRVREAENGDLPV